MRKFAALMALLNGFGFGLPAAYGTWYYAHYGFPWRFMSFPTHETGPFFEQFGLFTSWPLIAGFVLVCSAEVVCAAAVGQQARRPLAGVSTTALRAGLLGRVCAALWAARWSAADGGGFI